jgi:hypothetical protein
MRPFLPIAEPPLLPYLDFDRLVKKVDVSDKNLLQLSVDTLKHAKQGFDLLTKMDADSSRSVGCHEQWKTVRRKFLFYASSQPRWKCRVCLKVKLSILRISKISCGLALLPALH